MSPNLDQVLAAKLETSLENISSKLMHIEEQLRDIVRLQERVSNHDKTLARYGDKLDRHDVQLHQSEMWRASYGDKSDIERVLSDVRKDIRENAKRLDEIEKTSATNNGQKDVAKEILKWATGILTTLLIFILTGKS